MNVKELGIKNIYCGGAEQLYIEWIDEGTHFTINEYDGSESIETLESLQIVA